MVPTIQGVLDACEALNQQRHFAQRIVVGCQFNLTSEYIEPDGRPDARPTTVSTNVVGTCYLTYTPGEVLRMNSPGPAKVIGRPLVIAPARLAASVSTTIDGYTEYPHEMEISITAPMAINGPNAIVDIYSIEPGTKFKALWMQADPNATLPVQGIGTDSIWVSGLPPNPITNKVNLLLGVPAIKSTLPVGPVFVP